jgi:hypothetical protein
VHQVAVGGGDREQDVKPVGHRHGEIQRKHEARAFAGESARRRPLIKTEQVLMVSITTANITEKEAPGSH